MRDARKRDPEKYRGKARAKYAADPEGEKERLRAISLMAKYGITPEDYERMHEAQRGFCAICGRAETVRHQSGRIRRLAVDHNHDTGKVRGLLCYRCNVTLGWYERRKPSVDQYLRTYA